MFFCSFVVQEFLIVLFYFLFQRFTSLVFLFRLFGTIILHMELLLLVFLRELFYFFSLVHVVVEILVLIETILLFSFFTFFFWFFRCLQFCFLLFWFFYLDFYLLWLNPRNLPLKGHQLRTLRFILNFFLH